MREVNQLLMQYIDVPKPHSTPKRVFIPSPDMRPEALLNEHLSDLERQQLQQQQLYFQQTGIKIPNRYDYDIR